MKPLQERLKNLILYLESNRKGFKYHIKLVFCNKRSLWLLALVGESYEDKSLPSDYLSVEAEQIEQLPELASVKASDLLLKEIERNNKQVEDLNLAIVKLKEASERLKEFKQNIV